MAEPRRPTPRRAGAGTPPPNRPRPAGRGTAPPPRSPNSRAQAIFAILGLVVVFSLLFGLVAVGFDGVGRGSPTEDPFARPSGPNLVATYEARLRDNPDDVNTMLVLANILQNQGDFPNAIVWYERATTLKPTDTEARLAFGQALAAYGQNFDAEAQYRKVLELDPKSARAEFYLGQLYARWNPPRPDEARVRYTRASDLEPEGAWGRAARTALERLNATPTP